MTKKTETPERGNVREGEFHPAASSALHWFYFWRAEDPHRYMIVRESIASCAIEDNELAEILNSTLERLENGQPVSDRYLLGLCWYLRENFNDKE